MYINLKFRLCFTRRLEIQNYDTIPLVNCLWQFLVNVSPLVHLATTELQWLSEANIIMANKDDWICVINVHANCFINCDFTIKS